VCISLNIHTYIEWYAHTQYTCTCVSPLCTLHLSETSLPLMGVQQASEGTTPQPSCQPSPAINDVSDNLRAKLYILCNRIGNYAASYLSYQCALLHIGFQSYPADLSTEDKISLCIAEKYLDFKVSMEPCT